MKGYISLVRIFYVVIILIFSTTIAYTQPGDPGGDPDVPITGIEILIGAGGALGVKKILDKKKRKSSAD